MKQYKISLDADWPDDIREQLEQARRECLVRQQPGPEPSCDNQTSTDHEVER